MAQPRILASAGIVVSVILAMLIKKSIVFVLFPSDFSPLHLKTLDNDEIDMGIHEVHLPEALTQDVVAN